MHVSSIRFSNMCMSLFERVHVKIIAEIISPLKTVPLVYSKATGMAFLLSEYANTGHPYHLQ